jgi:hypothetical protein
VSPTIDPLHLMAPQTLDLVVVGPTEPQDPDHAPRLLVASRFETISTRTVMSDEAIEHNQVESTANGRSLQESEAEIRLVHFHLLAAVEDMLLEIALHSGV